MKSYSYKTLTLFATITDVWSRHRFVFCIQKVRYLCTALVSNTYIVTFLQYTIRHTHNTQLLNSRYANSLKFVFHIWIYDFRILFRCFFSCTNLFFFFKVNRSVLDKRINAHIYIPNEPTKYSLLTIIKKILICFPSTVHCYSFWCSLHRFHLHSFKEHTWA